MERKSWSDLDSKQQAGVVALAVVELLLTTAALVDLARRPAAQVRGPKAAWALGAFIQPVGPIAYFAAGIRRQG